MNEGAGHKNYGKNRAEWIATTTFNGNDYKVVVCCVTARSAFVAGSGALVEYLKENEVEVPTDDWTIRVVKEGTDDFEQLKWW